jgi:hypothetical protein
MKKEFFIIYMLISEILKETIQSRNKTVTDVLKYKK